MPDLDFYGDFEPSFLDEGWTTSETGSSTVSRVAGSPANRGSYALETTIVGTSVAYVEKALGNVAIAPGQWLTVGFYFKDTGIPDVSQYFIAGTATVTTWDYRFHNGSTGFRLRMRDDAGVVQNTAYVNRPAVGQWAWIVLAVRRATTHVAYDGEIRLYVNGHLRASLGSLDNYDRYAAFDRLQFGAPDTPKDGTTYQLDEIKIAIGTDACLEPHVPTPAGQTLDADGLLLLVTDNSDGWDFAEYCVSNWGLNRCRICPLPNATATETLASKATYDAEIENDLDSWLALNPTVAGQVMCFVVGPGVPGAFSDAGLDVSVTSRLMNYGNAYSQESSNPLYVSSGLPTTRPTLNALRSSGVYLAVRIDADTLAHAKDIVDAGLACSALTALEATDTLFLDSAAEPPLALQHLRMQIADSLPYDNAGAIWRDTGSPAFGAGGSRTTFTDDSILSAATLRATSSACGSALISGGFAAVLGFSDNVDIARAEVFFEALRLGWSFAEAAGLAVSKTDYTAVAAGGPLTTVAYSTTGHNAYRGTGDLSNVDFSQPIAYLRGGQTTVELPPGSSGGHDPNTRYTYAIRPVREGLEGLDVTCAEDFITDAQGDWTGGGPPAVESIDAEVLAEGKISVHWSFRTPYGRSPPHDFAVYYAAGPAITPGSPQATEGYTSDGSYHHLFSLADGQTCFFAVSARTAGGVDSPLSDVIGPFVADAAAPQTPTVYTSTRF